MSKDRKKESPTQDTPLVEGKDYVMEHGRLVFTAEYLRRRGTCCRSGCRNCPYGFRRSG